jgi:hypothetical protein
MVQRPDHIRGRLPIPLIVAPPTATTCPAAARNLVVSRASGGSCGIDSVNVERGHFGVLQRGPLGTKQDLGKIGREHQRRMRFVLPALGVVLVLLGAVWTLQGSNLLGGSVMSGSRQWLMIGLVALVALVAGLVVRAACLSGPAALRLSAPPRGSLRPVLV